MSVLIPFARAGAALYAAQEATGIIGYDEWVSALGRLIGRLAAQARRVDDGALDEMVQLARSRAPRDTGRLVNGISGSREGEVCVFTASAVHEGRSKSRADYARYVEFGRAAHAPIVADSAYFTGPASVGAADAQPFFVASWHDVLARRPQGMQRALDDAATEEGFA